MVPFEVSGLRQQAAEWLYARKADPYGSRVLRCHSKFGVCSCLFCSFYSDKRALNDAGKLEREWSPIRNPVPIVLGTLCDLGELDQARRELIAVLRWIRDTPNYSWMLSLIGGLVGAFECPIVIERGRPRYLLHLHAVIDATGDRAAVAKRIELVVRSAIERRRTLLRAVRAEETWVHAEELRTTIRKLARYSTKVGRAKSVRPEPYPLAVARARDDEERGRRASVATRWLLAHPGVYERVQAEVMACWYANPTVLAVRAPAKKGAPS